MTRPDRSSRSVALLAVSLAVVAAIPFLPSLGNGFTNWDDPIYVTANPHVRSGLTGASLRWAWTTTHTGNWIPLTWIVHQLAWTVFGSAAGGHHAVSILFHAASVALLFLTLARATGQTGPAAAVALLFGVHPLRVESVAWAAELKDVLATFFWILTMLLWVRWCERRSAVRYAAVAAGLVLSLLAKPMAMTLPWALVVFDRWPLGRLPLRKLVIEKVPLVALTLAAAAVAFAAQREAMPSTEVLPAAGRLANAAVSYLAYVGKVAWPAALSPFYPHRGPSVGFAAVAAAAALAAATVVVHRLRHRAPYLGFGWAWYVVTLVPVIGVVQLGSQSMADRYTYVPSIGLLVALVWGARDVLRRSPLSPRWITAVVAAGASILMALTWAQTSRWRDSVTLFTHAIALEPRNPLAHNNLGVALRAEGRLDEAIAHFRGVLEVAPRHLEARGNLALALREKGDLAGAEEQLREFLRDRADDPAMLAELGRLLVDTGRPAEALPLLERAAAILPTSAWIRFQWSRALGLAGRPSESIDQALVAERAGYREADLYAHLARECLRAERLEDARRALAILVAMRPDLASARESLAAVDARLRRRSGEVSAP